MNSFRPTPPPPRLAHRKAHCLLFTLALILARTVLAQPSPQAAATFAICAATAEMQLDRQHSSVGTFLSLTPADRAQAHAGQVVLQDLTPADRLPGALLHHWRGTAFASGATAAAFERLLRDFDTYPQHFAPDVLAAHATPGTAARQQAWMRIRQKHILTVVLDTTYDVQFSPSSGAQGFSTSRSTAIREIAAAGTPSEHALGPQDDHGFLWRQNTYWTWQERDGGLYVQLESLSLSRSIPTGLGWAVRPLVQTVPRQSLQFTLRSAVNAVRK